MVILPVRNSQQYLRRHLKHHIHQWQHLFISLLSHQVACENGVSVWKHWAHFDALSKERFSTFCVVITRCKSETTASLELRKPVMWKLFSQLLEDWLRSFPLL